MWAPNSTWTVASDAALQPTSDPARNAFYHFDVDYVKVITINANGTSPPPPTSGTSPPPPADTIAPGVAVSTPIHTYSYRSLSSATGTASDTGGSGLKEVRGRLQRLSDGLYWSGSAWVSALSEPVANGTTSWTFPFPRLANGKYSYQAIAVDWVGNTAWSAPNEFTVQGTQTQSVSPGGSS